MNKKKIRTKNEMNNVRNVEEEEETHTFIHNWCVLTKNLKRKAKDVNKKRKTQRE